jgi:hypothetical protein
MAVPRISIVGFGQRIEQTRRRDGRWSGYLGVIAPVTVTPLAVCRAQCGHPANDAIIDDQLRRLRRGHRRQTAVRVEPVSGLEHVMIVKRSEDSILIPL